MAQAIDNWRHQAEIDAGLRPGVTSSDNAELAAARRRIAQLESELAVARRAAELLREAVPQRALRDDGSRGSAVKPSCRLLEVTRAGYYGHLSRPPSARAIRHAWLTDLITEIHAASRGTSARRESRGAAVGAWHHRRAQRRSDADAPRRPAGPAGQTPLACPAGRAEHRRAGGDPAVSQVALDVRNVKSDRTTPTGVRGDGVARPTTGAVAFDLGASASAQG